MWRRGGVGRGDRHLQRWPWVSLDQVPRSWSTETSPGKVILGWSTAKVIAIPRRPLQCFKCLELGHVRTTCVSAVDRGHLCYRCGESGHCARGCPASAPKCPLCESLGAPANHRMGGVACATPKTKRKRPVREPAAAAKTQGSTAEATVDGRKEAMELAQ